MNYLSLFFWVLISFFSGYIISSLFVYYFAYKKSKVIIIRGRHIHHSRLALFLLSLQLPVFLQQKWIEIFSPGVFDYLIFSSFMGGIILHHYLNEGFV